MKRSLRGYELVVTVPEAGLAGLKNRQLLRKIAGDFEVFITTDKSIQFQQNLAAQAIAFVLLRARSNDITDILPLVPQLIARLDGLRAGELVVIE